MKWKRLRRSCWGRQAEVLTAAAAAAAELGPPEKLPDPVATAVFSSQFFSLRGFIFKDFTEQQKCQYP